MSNINLMYHEPLFQRTQQEPFPPIEPPHSSPQTLVELLESSPERLDPEVKVLFNIFAQTYPEAHEIRFELFPPQDSFDAGGYYQIATFPDRVVPIIFVSEGTYEQLKPLMDIRRTSVEINARLLGIAPELMTTRLLHRFIIVHELGHVLDFLKNYRHDDVDPYEAEAEMSNHREWSKATLPVPGLSPNELARELSALHSLAEVVEQFPELARHPGFSQCSGVEDVLRLQEQEYRSTPQERWADEFAVRFLTSHAGELGFPELEQDVEVIQKKAA